MAGPLQLLLALAAASVLCAPAAAQKMYRCGNNYQDKPCDGGQKGRVIGDTGVAPAAPAGAAPRPYEAFCSEKSKESLKVSWAREGGVTEERAMAEAQTRADKALVREVYSRRGSAAQVQAAIAADCVAQKEKEARAAELMEAALKAQREARGEAPRDPRGEGSGAPAPVSAPAAPRSGSVQAEADARNAEMKRRQCARYSQDMDTLTSKERVGGTPAVMARYAEERRSLQDRMRSEGC